MDNNIHFNSIEEVKEFLSTEDIATLGSIVFIDKDTGKTVTSSFKDFVQKAGIDKAAEFIFTNQNKLMQGSIEKDEIKTLMNKFLSNPGSLSEKEKMMVGAILGSIQNDPIMYLKNDIFNNITKFFVESDSKIAKQYTGILSILLTYLEAVLVSSSYLNKYTDNVVAMNEIAKEAEAKIHIDDDIDDVTLMLGLIHVIGNRFIGKKSKLDFNIDYNNLINMLSLNKKFVYECPGCKDKDCNQCTDKGTVNILDMPFEDMLEKDTDILQETIDKVMGDAIDVFKDYPSIDEEELNFFKKDNISNPSPKIEKTKETGKIVDIRDRLRRKD